MQFGDHLFDFFGRLLGAFGQRAHFVRHHRKTASLLTRTRRFNRRVERQQVGLLGNTLDHFQNAADRLAVTGQLVDHQH